MKIAFQDRKYQRDLVPFYTTCRANRARFFEESPNSSVYASFQRSQNAQISFLLSILNETKQQHRILSLRFIDLTATSSENDSSEEDSLLLDGDDDLTANMSTGTVTDDIIRENPWNDQGYLDGNYLRTTRHIRMQGAEDVSAFEGTSPLPLLGAADDSRHVPYDEDASPLPLFGAADDSDHVS